MTVRRVDAYAIEGDDRLFPTREEAELAEDRSMIEGALREFFEKQTTLDVPPEDLEALIEQMVNRKGLLATIFRPRDVIL